MIQTAFDLTNLNMRHVTLPNLGPVFLVDNFGFVAASSQEGVIQTIAHYLGKHRQPKPLNYLVRELYEMGAVPLLAAVNHSAYAIYKLEDHWGIEFVGTNALYEVTSQEHVFAVLRHDNVRRELGANRISDRSKLPDPIYVGFTALGMTQSRMMPMGVTVTRIPAKANSKAIWDTGAIAEALDKATQSEPAEAKPKDDHEAKLLAKLSASLADYNNPYHGNRSEALKSVVETINEIERLYPREKKTSLPSSLGETLLGYGQLPFWLGTFGNDHSQHPMAQIYQFPLQTVSETLTAILKREEHEAGTTKKPGFSIKHINELSSVITDKTFGGKLTIYYANAEEKDKLFERLNSLVELILTGENFIKFSFDILEKGVQDTWVFENVTISGPVMLTGRMVLTNINLHSGSYCEATMTGWK
jgi:hypothetical protein